MVGSLNVLPFSGPPACYHYHLQVPDCHGKLLSFTAPQDTRALDMAELQDQQQRHPGDTVWSRPAGKEGLGA